MYYLFFLKKRQKKTKTMNVCEHFHEDYVFWPCWMVMYLLRHTWFDEKTLLLPVCMRACICVGLPRMNVSSLVTLLFWQKKSKKN